MRLDHLLSKRKEVRVVLLLSYQGSQRERTRRYVNTSKAKLSRSRGTRDTRNQAECLEKQAFHTFIPVSSVDLISNAKVSGGDASGGHTRSHPEHDG